jgi:hypothetical protein
LPKKIPVLVFPLSAIAGAAALPAIVLKGPVMELPLLFNGVYPKLVVAAPDASFVLAIAALPLISAFSIVR